MMIYVLTALMILCATASIAAGFMAFAGGGSKLLSAIALAFGVIAFLCGHAIFA
jgi:hypothetical protein